MVSTRPLWQLIACDLILLTALGGVPVPASALPARQVVLGSVSAVGATQLRGVAVSREGTVFSGDRVRTGSQSYTTITLAPGPRLELAANTEVRVEGGDGALSIQLISGSVAFSSSPSAPSFSIRVAPYQIRAGPGSAGEVTMVGRTRLGVAAVSGRLIVQEQEQEPEQQEIDEGERVLILLDAGPEAVPSAAGAGTGGGGAGLAIGLTTAGVGGALGAFVALGGQEAASPSRP